MPEFWRHDAAGRPHWQVVEGPRVLTWASPAAPTFSWLEFFPCGHRGSRAGHGIPATVVHGARGCPADYHFFLFCSLCVVQGVASTGHSPGPPLPVGPQGVHSPFGPQFPYRQNRNKVESALQDAVSIQQSQLGTAWNTDSIRSLA